MFKRMTAIAIVTIGLPLTAGAQESACWLDCFNCLMMTEPECDDLGGIFCEGQTCDDDWCFICEPPILDVEVSPWDQIGHAFVTPGGQSTVDDVTITVFFEGNPVVNGVVEIDLGECNDLCIDAGDAGLAGVTDENGVLVLNPSAGGCEDCPVVVRVEGVPVAQYPRVKSTDFDGVGASGLVNPVDFAFFAAAFKVTQDACADYDGDGAVTGIDFSIFTTSFRLVDENQQVCP